MRAGYKTADHKSIVSAVIGVVIAAILFLSLAVANIVIGVVVAVILFLSAAGASVALYVVWHLVTI